MSNPQVFISYTKADADWARSFAEALKQRGVRVWLDQFQISAGESLREALETGLRESDVFVALFDPASPMKPNFLFELGAAIGMGKRVVSIVPRALENSTLPLELRARRYLMKDSPENTAEELAHALVVT